MAQQGEAAIASERPDSLYDAEVAEARSAGRSALEAALDRIEELERAAGIERAALRAALERIDELDPAAGEDRPNRACLGLDADGDVALSSLGTTPSASSPAQGGPKIGPVWLSR